MQPSPARSPPGLATRATFTCSMVVWGTYGVWWEERVKLSGYVLRFSVALDSNSEHPLL